MTPRVLLLLTGMFIGLMIFTIIQQVWSFIQHRKNPVSSISVIENPTGFHESSTIIFGGYTLIGQDATRKSLSFGQFNVSEHCSCRNSKTSSTCVMRGIDYQDPDLARTRVMAIETPLDYRHSELVSVTCDHIGVESLVFTYVISPMAFPEFIHLLDTLEGEARDKFIDEEIDALPNTWIHCSFFTSIHLSRTEYFTEHQPTSIKIDSFPTSTTNVYEDQTRILFSWREGRTTRIDKFTDRNIWSFALVLCSVILGLERCYAMVTRARNQIVAVKRKRQRKQSQTGAGAVNGAVSAC